VTSRSKKKDTLKSVSFFLVSPPGERLPPSAIQDTRRT